MSRAPIFLLLLAIVAVLIVLALRHGDGNSLAEPARIEPSAADAPAEATAEPGIAVAPNDTVRESATIDRAAPREQIRASHPQGFVGRVVDRYSQPLPGVAIYLIESPRNEPMALPMLRDQGLLMGPVTDTRTAADGSFALGLGLATDKLYELRLLLPQYADACIGDLRVLPDEWHDIGTITLERGKTIRGRVTVQGTSTPVPRAIVTVETGMIFEDAVLQGIPGRERGLHAIANPDGSYLIENAPAHGVVRIAAMATGFARVIHHDIDLSGPDAIEANFELPPGLVISGRVVDEQRLPIAGAVVEAWSDKSAAPPCVDHSRADGSFEVVGLQTGAHRLRVMSRSHQQLDLAEVAAGSRELQLELRARATVEVLVTGNGRTLRSYRLGVRRYFPSAENGGLAQIGKLPDLPDQRVRLDGMTDRFTVVGLPPVELALLIEADGFAKTLSSSFTITPETRSLTVDVAMTAGGTLRGRIVDERNRPLAGTTIRTQPAGAHPDNPVWRMLQRAVPDRFTEREVQSGQNGEFVLPQLAHADYQLEISHPDACRRLVPDLRIERTEERDLGAIRLLDGALVFGRATADGQVTGQVKIMLATVVEANASPLPATDAIQLETVTDSTGAFTMPRRVPPGVYELRAAAIDAGQPDGQVFQHLMQLQKSAIRLTIPRGQQHFEQHIDVVTNR